MSELEDTATYTLWECAKKFFDVNAIRFLFEFREREWVDIDFDKLGELSVPIPQCFMWSRHEQITFFLDRITIGRPSPRQIAYCRNYLDDERVVNLLLREIELGNLVALASVMLTGRSLPWSLFSKVEPSSEVQVCRLRNLTMENIRRGARHPDYHELAASSNAFRDIIQKNTLNDPESGPPLILS